MLHAVVLISQAVVERKSRRELPAILGVKRKVAISVAARKGWRTNGKRQGACRSLDDVPRGVSRAGKVPLRADGCLKQDQLSVDKIIQAVGRPIAHLFHRLGECAKTPIHLLIVELSAKAHRMPASAPVQILVALNGVLRATKREATRARLVVEKTRQLHGTAAHCCAIEQKQGRSVLERSVIGVTVVHAVEAELRAAEHRWREGARNVHEESLPVLFGADVVLGVRAAERSPAEINFIRPVHAKIGLCVIANDVVKPAEYIVRVLWRTAARILGNVEVHFAEDWCSIRNTSKRPVECSEGGANLGSSRCWVCSLRQCAGKREAICPVLVEIRLDVGCR